MTRDRDVDLSKLQHLPEIEQQAGVLAWLPGVDPVRFALVTSRRTGRWVFPKGAIDEGMTPPEAAAQEALEEAGLVGVADPTPVGSFRTPKIRPPLTWTLEVTIYPMRVDEVLDVWIEAGVRSRRFVTLKEARKLLNDPAMFAIAERFAASHE
jgi:8-oxo-dGTP pyrophosphatase MutT (NUDIX family)